MSEKEYQPFDNDVEEAGAYRYTTGAIYSAAVANRRLSDVTIEALDWSGLRVLDVGCGDGEYTNELYSRGKPQEIVGIDLSASAISAASAKNSIPTIRFEVSTGARLPFDDNSFDVVHMRGVLHHMEAPDMGVAEAFRVAPRVFIIEPNGWNAGLKCIEKLSSYHREHHERSFTSTKIDSWITRGAGKVVFRKWVGFVPFFCPTPIAKCMKLVEPVLEALPLARTLACAVYAVVGIRPTVDVKRVHSL